MIEKIKHAAAAAFTILGFGCFYGLQTPLNVAGFLAGIFLALLVLFFSDIGRRFIGYVKDSIVEVRKVVWPTRKETIQTTLIVFGFVVCISIFLWVVDKGLEWILYDLLLKRNLT